MIDFVIDMFIALPAIYLCCLWCYQKGTEEGQRHAKAERERERESVESSSGKQLT